LNEMNYTYQKYALLSKIQVHKNNPF